MPDVRTQESTGFGRRLRALREAQGLSQAALAERVGVSRQTIGNVEGGWTEPSWPLARRLAGALGVEVGAFVPTSDTQPAG